MVRSTSLHEASLLALVVALVASLHAHGALASPWADEPAGQEHVYTVSGGQARIAEVFFPPSADAARNADGPPARVPGMLMFHGGGWMGGTPAQFRRVCRHFAARGLVTATAQYRMLSKDERPTDGTSFKRVCITDARAAIRWMQASADKLGVDPRRIIVGGGSAGGHIGLLAATAPDEASDIRSSVVALVMFNPAFEAHDATDPEVDACRHIDANLPPMIVFFGSRDDIWLPGWEVLSTRLTSLGNMTTESWVAEGQPHGFFNRPPWQDATIAASDRFLVRLGLLTAAGAPSAEATGATLIRER